MAFKFLVFVQVKVLCAFKMNHGVSQSEHFKFWSTKVFVDVIDTFYSDPNTDQDLF